MVCNGRNFFGGRGGGGEVWLIKLCFHCRHPPSVGGPVGQPGVPNGVQGLPAVGVPRILQEERGGTPPVRSDAS